MNTISAPKWLLVALLVASCGSKDGSAICSIENAPETRKGYARDEAKTAYESPVIETCPELDPPLDGQATSPGLTGGEYASLLRGANGNFFDDHVWWIKALPRGESHVVPMHITAEHCDEVTFAKFGYEYRFATPPLTVAPECGRYLTGISVGHQLEDSWPQVFGIDGAGSIQLAPLSRSSELGPIVRTPRGPFDIPGRDSSIDIVDVVRHDGDSLEMVAVANGFSFASAARLVLKVGDISRLSVQVELEPRALASDNPLLALAALGGWFSNTQGHHFDRIRATFTDGTSLEVVLSDPDLDWGNGEWTSVPLTKTGAALESLALLQDRTHAEGNLRPDLLLSNIQTSVPVDLDVSVTTRAVPGGNVAGNLVVDSSAAIAAGSSISIAYLVTASTP
ncbi:MAG TPA: hypothetical protein VER96_27480 [Polyangiaceae bacterium]|nr:hypothetical protein [Polyangiaceae bacterium]